MRFSRQVLFWLFALTAMWAVVASALVYRNPLPIPDWGHRTFGVPNAEAVRALTEALEPHGLGEQFTMESGPTTQTVLADRDTVLLQRGEALRKAGYSGNAISVPVADPKRSAGIAAMIISQHGFWAETWEAPGELAGKLVVVRTNALDDGVLVFRKHVFEMGNPKRFRLTPY